MFNLGFELDFLFLVGFVGIGLSFSVAVIVVRLRSGDEFIAKARQQMIGLATAILACAALSPVLAVFISQLPISHYPTLLAPLPLICVGCSLLWPVSVIVTFLGQGTGRRMLLVAHGLIAIMWTALVLTYWIRYGGNPFSRILWFL